MCGCVWLEDGGISQCKGAWLYVFICCPVPGACLPFLEWPCSWQTSLILLSSMWVILLLSFVFMLYVCFPVTWVLHVHAGKWHRTWKKPKIWSVFWGAVTMAYFVIGRSTITLWKLLCVCIVYMYIYMNISRNSIATYIGHTKIHSWHMHDSCTAEPDQDNLPVKYLRISHDQNLL